MLNHVNCKPSPSVYSCKSFITDGPGHKFKDKSFFVVKNIDQYFVRSVLFFVLIINMQDKIRIQEPDTAQHQLSTRWWWWILDGGWLTILTWAACFVGVDAWVHVSSGEAGTQATHRRPVTSRGDICNEEDQSSVQSGCFCLSGFLFSSKQDPS